MKTTHQRFLIVLGLALVFFAPSVVAYLYYCHPTWLHASSTNRGRFVTPIYRLQSLDKRQHWRLVYWNPLPCTAQCMQHVDALARVRLALGRRLYQVDACLLLGAEQPALSFEQTKILQDTDVSVLKLPEQAQADRTTLGSQPAFFIVSPENALVLTYPMTVASDDLFHDIKRLITEPS